MKTALAFLVFGICILGASWRAGAGTFVRDGQAASSAGKIVEAEVGSAEGWTPEVPHPTAPNVIASSVRNEWKPASGYRWLNPADARDLRVTALPFGGIGAALGVSPMDGRPMVAEVLPGYPAATAGVKVGMVLVQIDATPTTGMSLNECIRLIRGEAGAAVQLETFDPATKSTRVFLIERALIEPK